MAKEMKRATPSLQDIERGAVDEAHLENTTVRSLAWHGISVERGGWTASTRSTPILSKVDGYAEAGTLSHYL